MSTLSRFISKNAFLSLATDGGIFLFLFSLLFLCFYLFSVVINLIYSWDTIHLNKDKFKFNACFCLLPLWQAFLPPLQQLPTFSHRKPSIAQHKILQGCCCVRGSKKAVCYHLLKHPQNAMHLKALPLAFFEEAIVACQNHALPNLTSIKIQGQILLREPTRVRRNRTQTFNLVILQMPYTKQSILNIRLELDYLFFLQLTQNQLCRMKYQG